MKENRAYRTVQNKSLDEIGAVLHEMEHIGTGAKLVWLEREDENKTFGITFATQPEDSKGVFHILEHSLLCGSQRYPVKEPFVELMKSSLNTFLNAMTFPDKTMFPVASRNEKEFINLMRVYLDAVFFPLIYSRQEIFCQEGWHYELDDNGVPSYKGVVLGEMRGAYADCEQLISDTLQSRLFPDTCYRFSSGGDPTMIPELTYEQFLDAHHRFYSPSNSFIFLDGTMDIDHVLSIIDAEYLSRLDRGVRIAPPAQQTPVHPEPVTIQYEVSGDEDTDKKNYLAFGHVIGAWNEQQDIAAVMLLSNVLCGGISAPLSKCVIDKGLAEEISIQIQDGIAQPWAMMEVRNCTMEHIPDVKKAIFDELRFLADGGLDHAQLEAALANVEFQYRERDYGSMPEGLGFGMSMMETWLYGGDPAKNLVMGELFDALHLKLKSGYFEDLIRRIFLENPHWCEVVAQPSKTLGEERRARERASLDAKARKWTEGDRLLIRQLQQKTESWQKSKDTPETLACLPHLALDDLSDDVEHIPLEIRQMNGIQLLTHDIPTRGIVYCNLYFDISDKTEQELAALSLLSSVLGQIPTRNCSAEQLKYRRRLLCGRLSYNVYIGGRKDSPLDVVRKFAVSFSCLAQNLMPAAQLVSEIMTQSLLDTKDSVLAIAAQFKSVMPQVFTMAGDNIAFNRVAAQFTSVGVAIDWVCGYEYYRWLKQYYADWDQLYQRLSQAYTVFTQERLMVSVTGGEQAPDIAADIFASTLPHGEIGHTYFLKPWGIRHEGIEAPTDIAFACKGGLSAGSLNGVDELAKRIESTGYLWNMIRVQGGAYGANMSASPTGLIYCTTYRDPDAAASLGVFDGVPDDLRQMSESDLTGFIIGTIADLSPLSTPRTRANAGDKRYLTGKTEDDLRLFRKEILTCTRENLLEAAEHAEHALKQNGICVVGGRHQLEHCQLDEILSM